MLCIYAWKNCLRKATMRNVEKKKRLKDKNKMLSKVRNTERFFFLSNARTSSRRVYVFFVWLPSTYTSMWFSYDFFYFRPRGAHYCVLQQRYALAGRQIMSASSMFGNFCLFGWENVMCLGGGGANHLKNPRAQCLGFYFTTIAELK